MWDEPILHVDMDSFFVEVERLDDPGLRGRPVAVGGAGPRGVIASASYEARRHGVHSAQPTSIARRLCPDLIVVPSTHGRYSDVSAEVFAVFRSFTPIVEGLSLDEAFLDVGGLRLHYESPVAVGEAVRGRMRSELGLPASVGVASVKFIAKLASKTAKPDGLHHVPAGAQLLFLHSLPASEMWGVGPATLAALARLGVSSIGDIAEVPIEALVAAVGPSTGRHLHELAVGRDPRPVVPDIASKSISVEETYDLDLETADVIETALLAHAQRLSGRLRRAGLRAGTVTLKLRYPDFTTITRSVTVPSAVDGSRQLFKVAGELLAAIDTERPVRLLGLGVSSLEPADLPTQLDIGSDEGWERVEDAVAEVRERFGEAAVGPARLLPNLEPEATEPEPM
ncbi:MAG: DNA polymerase IV [Acidimicrobiia bacterium]